MTKLYAFCNGGEHGWMLGITIDQDGQEVAQHLSTNEDWLAHDLGVASQIKHEIYDEQYGAGRWSIEYVSYDEVPSHKQLQECLEKHSSRQVQTVV